MSNFIKYFSEYAHVLKQFNAECCVQLKAYEVRLKAKKTWDLTLKLSIPCSMPSFKM